MVKALCNQKVVDRKTTEEQIDLLGLKETIDRLATANGMNMEWQEKVRMTKEDQEEASIRGDREDWFEEGGCSELRQVTSNCRRIGVNLTIFAMGPTRDKN